MSEALLRAVERLSPRTIAVVGLAKNCGKTTALNALIAAYAGRGLGLGVTSAGRDGEARDVLTLREKPGIDLPRGTLVATAERTLERWGAPTEALRRLGVVGPMGELVLVRATGAGRAEIAGPPTVATVMAALEQLRRFGAERVLIDGALDRVAVGHPGLADAVVLAAGAVLAGSAEGVARVAGDRLEVLRLPTPPEELRGVLEEIAEGLAARAAAVSEDLELTELSDSALADPSSAARAARGARWLYCGGAVTDDLLVTLRTAGFSGGLVARDPTRVFVGRRALGEWRGSGGGLSVLRSLHLAAVVTNPHNPTGPDLGPAELADAVARATGDLPVLDVVAGVAGNAGANW